MRIICRNSLTVNATKLQDPKAGEKFDLEIRYYGSKSMQYQLYDIDVETFDYEKGRPYNIGNVS